jgi:hypothetical protein
LIPKHSDNSFSWYILIETRKRRVVSLRSVGLELARSDAAESASGMKINTSLQTF